MKSFNKPWFLSYLSMIFFQVFYIFMLVKDPVFIHHTTTEAHLEEPVGVEERTEEGGKQVRFVGQDPVKARLSPFTVKELLRFAGILFLLYSAAVYLSNLAFQHTSVGSATIMATTNGIFMLAFGLAFGSDSFTWPKLASAALSLAGAIFLVVGEVPLGDWRLGGNLMSFGSSALYALHSVVLRRLSKGDSSRVSFPLLLAIAGTYSMVLLWPIFLLLHYTEVEPFVWPYDLASWASILFNVIFGSLLPAYLWTAAFELTTPMAVALGISCTVPLTLAFEVLYSHEVQWYSLVAGGLVVAGFLMINSRNLCERAKTVE